jgi:hypothetical protein
LKIDQLPKAFAKLFFGISINSLINQAAAGGNDIAITILRKNQSR